MIPALRSGPLAVMAHTECRDAERFRNFVDISELFAVSSACDRAARPLSVIRAAANGCGNT